jgi:hypothetical protein
MAVRAQPRRARARSRRVAPSRPSSFARRTSSRRSTGSCGRRPSRSWAARSSSPPAYATKRTKSSTSLGTRSVRGDHRQVGAPHRQHAARHAIGPHAGERHRRAPSSASRGNPWSRPASNTRLPRHQNTPNTNASMPCARASDDAAADRDRIAVVVLAEQRHLRLRVALEARPAGAHQLPLGEAGMEGRVAFGDRVPARVDVGGEAHAATNVTGRARPVLSQKLPPTVDSCARMAQEDGPRSPREERERCTTPRWFSRCVMK